MFSNRTRKGLVLIILQNWRRVSSIVNNSVVNFRRRIQNCVHRRAVSNIDFMIHENFSYRVQHTHTVNSLVKFSLDQVCTTVVHPKSPATSIIYTGSGSSRDITMIWTSITIFGDVSFSTFWSQHANILVLHLECLRI